MIGTSSAQKLMFFFLSSSCYFSSSALVLLESMDKFEHMYASELQLSTRSPFHCQDRFPRLLKRGSENDVENRVEKVFPKGPQMDPKSRQTLITTCSRGFQKGTSKMDPLQYQEK